MPLRARHVLSATLVALALGGCNSDSGGSTNVTNTDSNQVGSVFDNQPQNLTATPWQMPVSGVFLYDDTTTTGYAWTSTATSQARPGAANEDLVVDYSLVGSGQSDVGFVATTISNGSGDSNFGVVDCDDSFGSYTGIFARTADNAIFSNHAGNWVRHLPNTTAVGTTWESDRGLVAGAEVFAYTTDGTVAHTPRIRLSSAGNNAVDSNGNATSDATRAMVDYTTSTAYLGQWVQVRRIAVNRVAATGVTSPNGVAGCIEVSTTYSYRAVNRPQSYTSTVGLDLFAGSSTWYWKPGKGIVHETQSETVPQRGFALDSSRNSEPGDASLAAYNTAYDSQIYGLPGTYGNQPYYIGYLYGFTDGYRDISISGNPTNRQADLPTALQSEVPGFDLLSDSYDDGANQGYYAAFQAGYNAGFSAGGLDWDGDYNAVANGNDTLKAGANTTPVYPTFNDLPAAYRWDGMVSVNSLPGYTSILAGTSPTGHAYANGWDGEGETRTIYNSSVTSDLTAIRPVKDTNNQDKTRMIKLPAMGRTITTSTVREQTEQAAAAAPANG